MKFDFMGLVANYISLGLVAICGILINIIIIKFFTPADLGIYNLSYALFVVISQLSCFGVHYSCLKSLSVEDKGRAAEILIAALLLVLFISIVISSIFYVCIPLILVIFSGSDIESSLPLIAIALIFYALNKVLMFSVNGLGRMHLYASMQAVRALLLLSYIIAASIIKFDYPLVGAFLLSEIILLVAMLVILSPQLLLRVSLKNIRHWVVDHFKFGRSAILSGLSTEINTRVDVLFLAFFMNDVIVGIYSFVSMLVEGFYQLLVVVKNNINPLLARFIRNQEYDQLEYFAHKVFTLSVLATFISALIMYMVYPIFVEMFGLGDEVGSALYILATLLTFMVLSSGWLPFDQILTQAGKPMLSSRLYIAVTLLNMLLNLLLVPFLGMLGAAIGTGVSWLAFSLLLNYIVSRQIKISLFPVQQYWKV